MKFKRLLTVLPATALLLAPVALVACSNNTQASDSANAIASDLGTAFKALNAQNDLAILPGVNTDNNLTLNDGNEDSTLRAGTKVQYSALFGLLNGDFGLKSDGTFVDQGTKFRAKLNPLLPDGKELAQADLTNIARVVIGNESNPQDLLPQSRTNAIVNVDVRITIYLRSGFRFQGSNATNVNTIAGTIPVRLRDYRRVDGSTITGANKTITIKNAIPGTDQAIKDAIIASLNARFDLNKAENDNPAFPIPNVDAQGNVLFPDSGYGGTAGRRVLSNAQVADFFTFYQAAQGQTSDFGMPRVQRAIEKITFKEAADNSMFTHTAGTNTVTFKVDVDVDFLHFWSWGKTPYSDNQKTGTIKDINLTVNFEPAIDLGTTFKALNAQNDLDILPGVNPDANLTLNDGNEDSTLRAGTNVQYSALFGLLNAYFGLKSDGTLLGTGATLGARFRQKLNPLLATEKSLNASDLTKIARVVIGNDKNPQDLLPQSRINAIVGVPLNITIYLKPGNTFAGTNSSVTTITGTDVPVRLKDYRRVDGTTITGVDNKAITINSTIPMGDQAIKDAIIASLNARFDLNKPENDNPAFPIPNVDADGNVIFKDSGFGGTPGRRVLSNAQVDDFFTYYRAVEGQTSDFGKPRVQRAIEKITFKEATDNPMFTTNTGTNIVTFKVDVDVDFLHFWSWGKTPYSNNQKTGTIKNITITATFNATGN